MNNPFGNNCMEANTESDTKADMGIVDKEGNIFCINCGELVKICTGQCGDDLCGEEWVHSKTHKHKCDLKGD